jgi:hypothetical protein
VRLADACTVPIQDFQQLLFIVSEFVPMTFPSSFMAPMIFPKSLIITWFLSPASMLLQLFNQFKVLTTKTASRLPVVIAVIVLIFLTAVWHGRANISDHPLSYVKGY